MDCGMKGVCQTETMFDVEKNSNSTTLFAAV